jgi:hypothetical protein
VFPILPRFPFFPVSHSSPFPFLPPCKPFGTQPNARNTRDSPRVFEEPLNFLFAKSENSFNPQPTARNLTKPARSPRWGSNRWRSYDSSDA